MRYFTTSIIAIMGLVIIGAIAMVQQVNGVMMGSIITGIISLGGYDLKKQLDETKIHNAVRKRENNYVTKSGS